MNKKFKKLREKAEKLINDNKKNINEQQYRQDLSKLIEELTINQNELELQNDELRKTQQDLETQKNRFADLYNNAPVGYVLFNNKGIILDLNTKAAEILSSPKKNLLNKPFVSFLDNDSVSNFYNHIKNVFSPNNFNNFLLEITAKNLLKEYKQLKINSNLLKDENSGQKYCRSIIEDVTEENLFTEQLQALNNRLENSMIAGNMAWWEMHLPSGKIFFNDNKAKMLGYNPDDFKHYNDFMKLVHKEDYPKTMITMKKHLNGEKEHYQCQYRIKHKKGTYLWFSDIGKISPQKGNKIILNGIVTDITEKKLSDEKLLQLNNELKTTIEELSVKNETVDQERKQLLSLLDSIPAHIYVADKDTYKILFVNKTMRKLYGRDITGEKCYKAIQSKDQKCKNCTNKIIFRQKKPYFWQYHNSNLNRDFYVMDKALKWIDGRDVRFEMATDITHIKEIERKLKESQENLKILINNIPLAVFLHRNFEDGRFIMVNKTAEKYTGYSKEELLNLKVSDLDKESVDKKDSENLWKTIEKGKTYTIERKHIRKNGSSYIAEINFSLINFKNKPAIIAIVDDITERKESEKLLKELNATKDKFFSIIAHDLKNPFNSILGFSDLLVRNIDKYDKSKIKTFVQAINESSKNTFKLLENLLQWSRSQTGRINFNPERISAKELIAESTGLVQNQFKKKNISVNYSVQNSLELVADRNMLNTVLRNLISNAVKFTPREGNVEIKAIKENSNVIFSVSDNGIGMDKQKQEKLFKISEKVSSVGTENEQGTGIGLILCKEFVEKHNGKIWAESQVNKGSIFYFTIPLP